VSAKTIGSIGRSLRANALQVQYDEGLGTKC
jgi:hypothetical protein